MMHLHFQLFAVPKLLSLSSEFANSHEF